MNDSLTLQSALGRLIADKGEGLLQDPARLQGLLLDALPEARRDITALLQAHADGIVPSLREGATREPMVSLLRRLALAMIADHPISETAAINTVCTWAEGLGLADQATCDRVRHAPSAQVPVSAPRPAPPLPPGPGPGPRPPAVPPGERLLGWWRGLGKSGQRLGTGLLALLTLGTALLALRPGDGIASIELPDPVLADGQSRSLTVVTTNLRKRVSKVEVAVLKGNWDKSHWSVEVPPGQAQGPRIGAGTLSSRAAQDNDNELSFTLLFEDGSRSKPVARRFTVKAVPTIAAQILSVTASGAFSVDKETRIRIEYQSGNRDIVKLRRKVLKTQSSWIDQQARIVAMPDARGKARGVFDYSVTPRQAEQGVEFEFVLIDASGTESAPMTFRFDVRGKPAGTPAPAAVPPPAPAPARPSTPAPSRPPGTSPFPWPPFPLPKLPAAPHNPLFHGRLAAGGGVLAVLPDRSETILA